MKKHSYILILLIVLLSTPVSAQDYLDSYLEVAAGSNAGLQSKFNDYLASLEAVPQVKALPDPQVAFGYFIQPVETRMGPQEFKFSASQMFPWFGTLGARADAATQMAKAKYETFEEARSHLHNEVRSSYYNLYFTHKAIDVTLENLEIMNTLRNLVLIKVEAGQVSAIDEYRIELEIGDLENQLALLRDNLNVQTVSFYNLLNVDNMGAVELPPVLQMSMLLQEKEMVLDSIRAQNHQLLSLDHQIESMGYKQEAARRSGLPNFSVGLEYMVIGKGENNMAGKDAFVFPNIGITIPLYRNKYRAMVNEVIYLEAAKQHEKTDRVNLLETIYENTYRDLRDAGRRLELYSDQLTLAEKSRDILQFEYATNNANFEEILRMERQVFKYALEIEKARADHEAAVSFINYLMGK